MPRRSSAVGRLCVALAALGVIAFCGCSSAAGTAFTAAGAQSKVADAILVAVAVLVELSVMILPGACVVLFGYAVVMKRDRLTPKVWGGLACVLAGVLLLWALRVKQATEPAGAAANPAADAFVPQPRSGELLPHEGAFVMVPAPGNMTPGGPAPEEWRQDLAKSLSQAIAQGQEQVVMVFSREGCPWCTRLEPVLHRAIVERARDIMTSMGGGMDAAPQSAFAVGGGGAGATGEGLTLAPLRIFILDASEFPAIMQNFGVQAFPTMIFFGPPGAPPMMAQGYLDDDKMREAIRTAATASPDMVEPPAEQQKRGKRRGLFR
eukprot:TRINITY_DN6184_c0_g1_i1.p1 TRINITY_DN6184_c0_g1~~TRINITY_DN6184_c0_g1_i1.p1  ORF type:complete len:341 (-),score=61.79 TRINITY_DN6184_c0_g1_i1:448-1410(-)